MSDKNDAPKSTQQTRRQLLQRLGLGAAAAGLAYASPVLLDLNKASASRGSWGSRDSWGSRHHRGSYGSRGRGRRHPVFGHHPGKGPPRRPRRAERRRRSRDLTDWQLWIGLDGKL
ncbi:twin-arginine translocation signal domain-containing protein [Aquibaculum sediminis]|uniref:twin-arginine translocation signal domain-containing protein n=1 Tax=Aquibaculum sediminis TaxID=3231907 RepID=UPI00345621A4